MYAVIKFSCSSQFEFFDFISFYLLNCNINSKLILIILFISKVVLGGGQEAMDVTTTSTRIGKFDARFFHLIFEEEFGRIKGHFCPINSVQFTPDGQGYASGGEDGYIRLHFFDQSYYDFEFEY